MTDKPPRKPFNLNAMPEKEDVGVKRDKDNAQPRLKPPAAAKIPSPRLAPPGMTGTRQNLPRPETVKQQPKPFKLGDKGDLKDRFKPIVQKDHGKKGPDISR